jgi:acetoin utilization deacetylase AcuC-like enzyme
MQALHQALAELDARFDPDMVIHLAGADPHEGDRLGRLKLTQDGMQERDRVVLDWAWQRGLPTVLCMGGGYGHDIDTTVGVQVQTWRVAQSYWQRWQNRKTPSIEYTR